MFTVEHLFYSILALIGGVLTLKLFGALFSVVTVLIIVCIPLVVYAYRRNGSNVLQTYTWLKTKFIDLKNKFSK